MLVNPNARKTFIHDPLPPIPKLERIDGAQRLYRTPEGKLYPSMTTVLSADPKKKKGLAKWAKKIGEEEAARISQYAADRGTAVHKMLEDYVDNKEDYTKGHKDRDIAFFKRMKKEADKLDNVRAQEVQLYSDALGVAGTVDFVGDYEGLLSVVDYKTSGKFKKEKWIEDYYIQVSGYSYMLEERTGLVIPNIVIIIMVEEDIKPQVFTANRIHYRDKLIERIKIWREQNADI